MLKEKSVLATPHSLGTTMMLVPGITKYVLERLNPPTRRAEIIMPVFNLAGNLVFDPAVREARAYERLPLVLRVLHAHRHLIELVVAHGCEELSCDLCAARAASGVGLSLDLLSLKVPAMCVGTLPNPLYLDDTKELPQSHDLIGLAHEMVYDAYQLADSANATSKEFASLFDVMTTQSVLIGTSSLMDAADSVLAAYASLIRQHGLRRLA